MQLESPVRFSTMTEKVSSRSLSIRLRPFAIIMVCTLLTGVSYGFGMYLFPMVLPEMLRDLGLNYTDAGLITGIGQISPLLAIPLTAYLTQRLGGLRLIIFVQLAGAVLLLLLGLVQGFAGLVAVIFLMRSWPIMVWIPLVAIAAEHIELKWRATMMTVASGGACFFVLVDGNLSSFFLEHHGWRSMWQVVTFLCLVNAFGCWLVLRAVGCWNSARPGGKVIKSPVPDLFAWLKSRSGIIILLIFATIGLSFIPFQMYLAPYLRDDLGVGLKMTSLIWSTMGISGIIGGVAMGLFTDRYGVRPSFIIIFAAAGLSSALICMEITPLRLVGMALLFGVAQAVIFGLGPAYISKVMPPEAAATANSAATMVLVSTSIGANILAGWSRGLLGSFWYLYAALGALFVVGAVISLGLKKEI